MSPITVIAILIAVVLTAVISVFATIAYRKSVSEAKVGSAEEKAREILDDALKNAEAKKREALLEAKEEALRAKNDFEKESRERRMELQRYEKRVLNKEEALDRKSDVLEKKEQSLAHKEGALEKQKAKVEELHEKRLQELERISGLTSEQAKDYLLKTVEDGGHGQRNEDQGQRRSIQKGKGICRNSDSEMCGRPCSRDNNFFSPAAE